jgi:NAD(P)-dependent dehydrogenase (short-subunit alcohol dehydrogenase family)
VSRLSGKVVLVTGGARGIGEAITRLFASEGANVHFCGRNEERGTALEAEVRDAGGVASYAKCDVADEQAVKAWVDGVAAAEGRIDAVINNAGIAPAGPLEELSLDTWNEVVSTNVTSMFLVTRASIPHLRAGGGGTIVNLGSTFGVVGANGSAVYAMTKAAAISLSKSMALELAPDGIRVNALCPGGTETPFIKDWFVATGDPDGTRTWLTEHHPMGRLGQPDEQAKAALFLVSDESSFVTGHALLVDGGYTAQ